MHNYAIVALFVCKTLANVAISVGEVSLAIGDSFAAQPATYDVINKYSYDLCSVGSIDVHADFLVAVNSSVEYSITSANCNANFMVVYMFPPSGFAVEAFQDSWTGPRIQITGFNATTKIPVNSMQLFIRITKISTTYTGFHTLVTTRLNTTVMADPSTREDRGVYHVFNGTSEEPVLLAQAALKTDGLDGIQMMFTGECRDIEIWKGYRQRDTTYIYGQPAKSSCGAPVPRTTLPSFLFGQYFIIVAHTTPNCTVTWFPKRYDKTLPLEVYESGVITSPGFTGAAIGGQHFLEFNISKYNPNQDSLDFHLYSPLIEDQQIFIVDEVTKSRATFNRTNPLCAYSTRSPYILMTYSWTCSTNPPCDDGLLLRYDLNYNQTIRTELSVALSPVDASYVVSGSDLPSLKTLTVTADSAAAGVYLRIWFFNQPSTDFTVTDENNKTINSTQVKADETHLFGSRVVVDFGSNTEYSIALFFRRAAHLESFFVNPIYSIFTDDLNGYSVTLGSLSLVCATFFTPLNTSPTFMLTPTYVKPSCEARVYSFGVPGTTEKNLLHSFSAASSAGSIVSAFAATVCLQVNCTATLKVASVFGPSSPQLTRVQDQDRVFVMSRDYPGRIDGLAKASSLQYAFRTRANSSEHFSGELVTFATQSALNRLAINFTDGGGGREFTASQSNVPVDGRASDLQVTFAYTDGPASFLLRLDLNPHGANKDTGAASSLAYAASLAVLLTAVLCC